MCAITGMYHPDADFPIEGSVLRCMTRILKHRGPDDEGFYVGSGVALGHRRLSIVDLEGGRQPVENEDGSILVVFNGEIYNHTQLMRSLKERGHRFRSRCDTEVLVHLYEDLGEEFVNELNGQFAVAIWDKRRRKLILARDRVGIRPLYYSTVSDGTFLFASQIKSLFCHPLHKRALDLIGLEQTLTLWVTVPPRTIFEGVCELAPGCIASVDHQGIRVRRYWKHSFPDKGDYDYAPICTYCSDLEELLYDSVAIRLKADVAVGAYLSGGLDSSIIAALATKVTDNPLLSFSVTFGDSSYDEGYFQEMMSKRLHTDHKTITIDNKKIAEIFPRVVWHAENPMMRSAPAPLLMLSALVNGRGIKVVLTGEGADEVFGGYNIFKENSVRRFWAKNPSSRIRPHLLARIYPYIQTKGAANAFWQAFFKRGLTDLSSPYYSHALRWGNMERIKRLVRPEIRSQFDQKQHVFDELDAYLDPDMMRWDPLCRAQYLEMTLFMSGYLLSSQGDRMMMANSVEGRFPFLDHRVIEFAAKLPPEYKLHILEEKYILKRAFSHQLPPEITQRPKQPYRAPIADSFLSSGDTLSSSMLNAENIRSGSLFDPVAVDILVQKLAAASAGGISAMDDMAIAAIVSIQLLGSQYLEYPVFSC